jgi:DNA helicase-2/ATP-dependent DNA helicase PcrA
MEPEVDLCAIDRGSVSAPAGCGKTHVIAAALARHAGPKPIQVLTHTNAGVMALKTRLDKAGVKPSVYRLSTLDGWAMRLIRTFPMRSGHDPAILELMRPSHDYHEIRRSAAALLQAGHLADVLYASYDRLFVDEYQDCSELQHAIVGIASETLRTCVLGDPLQAIFGFTGRLADWEADVRTHFPHIAQLSTPWRWINAGERAFGEWLLDVRSRLLARQPIDFRSAPPNVTWVPLDGRDDRAKRLMACQTKAPTESGSVLIIGDSRDPASQRRFASDTPGAVAVEGVELRDLVDFARRFDLRHPDALVRIGEFADVVMSGADGSGLASRIRALRTDSSASLTEVERASLAFMSAPSYRRAVAVLVELGRKRGARTHRPLVLACCIKALNASADDAPGAFVETAIRAREGNRLLGRPIPARAVGSTLLLKGFEADVSVVLDVENMDAAHLYVAMTRGSKRLVVCSRSPVLTV